MKKVLTQDGSYTLYSDTYQQEYHSYVGAIKETIEKFIKPACFERYSHIRLLDVGFGLGYNALYSLKESSLPIDIFSLEQDQSILEKALEFHTDPFFMNIIQQLMKQQYYQTEAQKLQLYFADARDTVDRLLLEHQNTLTHVFLDAFSPAVNPELWTVNFFKKLYQLLISDGRFITYSSSLAVISGLQKAGFFVDYTQAIGRKRGGIIAYKQEQFVQKGLSARDQFFIQHSCQGFPNIDKGRWSTEEIRAYRQRIKELSVALKFRLSHKNALRSWDKIQEQG